MYNTIFANLAVRRFASVISIFLATVAFLWTVPSDATTNVGTAGAQFLKIGPGARVDSLGGAFGGLANDVTSIYWNPAGLSQLKQTSFSDTHTIWLADISIQLPRIRHTGREGRHLGGKRYIPQRPRYGNHNACKAGRNGALVLCMGCSSVSGVFQTTL